MKIFMVIFLKINLTISCLSQEQSEQFSFTKIIFEWFKFLGNYIFMNWVVLNQYVLMNNDQKTYQELFWEWCWSRARRNSGRWGTQCKITKFVTFLSFLFVRGVSLDHFCLSSHICTKSDIFQVCQVCGDSLPEHAEVHHHTPGNLSIFVGPIGYRPNRGFLHLHHPAVSRLSINSPIQVISASPPT